MSVEYLPYGDHRIVEKSGVFKIGTDAIVLCAFAGLKGLLKACDLGCGSGVISIIMACKNHEIKIDAIDISPQAAQLAAENVQLNGFSDRIDVMCADLKDLEAFESGSYDAVLCNPPYMKVGSGKASKDKNIDMARRENQCTIFDVCTTAGRIVRFGGSFHVVYKMDRLCDLFDAMRRSNLEPKSICFVCHDVKSAPSIVLLKGIKGAKPGLDSCKNLYLKDEYGQDSPQMKKVFCGEDL